MNILLNLLGDILINAILLGVHILNPIVGIIMFITMLFISLLALLKPVFECIVFICTLFIFILCLPILLVIVSIKEIANAYNSNFKGVVK